MAAIMVPTRLPRTNRVVAIATPIQTQTTDRSVKREMVVESSRKFSRTTVGVVMILAS